MFLSQGAPWGRSPSGGRLPPQGGGPPGGKTISFSAEKETVLHPKEKEGAGLWWVFGRPRRLSSLRTVWGPAPAVTAIPWWNREKTVVLSLGRLDVPLSRQSAAGTHRGCCVPCKSPSPPQRRHLTTPALREAPAGGGGLERRPVPVPQGQAVTAGRGPQCHTKAASRRFLPQAYRRPGPFFFGVKARFFFRTKRNGPGPCRAGTPRRDSAPRRAATPGADPWGPLTPW